MNESDLAALLGCTGCGVPGWEVEGVETVDLVRAEKDSILYLRSMAGFDGEDVGLSILLTTSVLVSRSRTAPPI